MLVSSPVQACEHKEYSTLRSGSSNMVRRGTQIWKINTLMRGAGQTEQRGTGWFDG